MLQEWNSCIQLDKLLIQEHIIAQLCIKAKCTFLVITIYGKFTFLGGEYRDGDDEESRRYFNDMWEYDIGLSKLILITKYSNKYLE